MSLGGSGPLNVFTNSFPELWLLAGSRVTRSTFYQAVWVKHLYTWCLLPWCPFWFAGTLFGSLTSPMGRGLTSWTHLSHVLASVSTSLLFSSTVERSFIECEGRSKPWSLVPCPSHLQVISFTHFCDCTLDLVIFWSSFTLEIIKFTPPTLWPALPCFQCAHLLTLSFLVPQLGPPVYPSSSLLWAIGCSSLSRLDPCFITHMLQTNPSDSNYLPCLCS